MRLHGRRVAHIMLIGAAALLLVLASGYLAIGGSKTFRAEGAGPKLRFDGVSPSFSAPQPVLAKDSRDGPPPTTAGLAAVLGPLLARPELGTVGVSVVDLEQPRQQRDQQGSQLFAKDVQLSLTPASTTKVLTALTVLRVRHPTDRLVTRVVSGAGPGEVVLIGGGDPTLSMDGHGRYPGAGRLDKLAADVKKAAKNVAPTKLLVDSSAFAGPDQHPTWDSGVVTEGYVAPIRSVAVDGGRLAPDADARSSTPDLYAGQQLAKALGVPESAVSFGQAPTKPKELARVVSPTIHQLTEYMLQTSDNVLAESLARQVALAQGQPGSFAGAAQAMQTVLAELSITGVELADGSGLSRANKINPDALTTALSLAGSPEHARLRGVITGLPVASYNGTLAQRFTQSTSQSAAGQVRAKTGTLSQVSALAGVTLTAEGRLLGFAVLANGFPGENEATTRQLLDQIAASLAACGCR